MIVINLKTYKQGKEVLKIVRTIQKYSPKSIIAVQPNDIDKIFSVFKRKIKIYSQHVDYAKKSGRDTGFILPETIKKDGAKGSLLNHSEHPVSLKAIKETINQCNKLKLKLIVCSSDLKQIKEIKKLNPYSIAFEDSKLIETKKSITKYNVKDLKKFILLLKKTKIIPLCGAGISSRKDVVEAKKLGCKGVLISSIVAKSKNPKKFLKEMKKEKRIVVAGIILMIMIYLMQLPVKL